jgi:polyribonucleotide nucleotidyltransferase
VANLQPHSTTATIGDRTLTFSTGRLAKQAGGSVTVQLGDTVVLSATTAAKAPRDQVDFFPLTVDVEERMYAAGKIPGGFFRREGKASEDATLTCRLTDRPLRPCFPKGFRNEVHVVMTVLAIDDANPYDVVAINAAGASTLLAGLPFSGPIGAARVSHVDGQWVAFPTWEEGERATFDMIVAGRLLPDGGIAITMVEAEATTSTVKLIEGGAPKPTEEVVAEGLQFAEGAIKACCEAQLELARIAAKETAEYPVFAEYGDDALAAVRGAVESELATALTIAGKQERETELDRIKDLAKEKLAAEFEGREKEISAAYRSLTKTLVRQRIVKEKVRIDGRGLTDIRELHADVDVLPRVHGSSLFERGETQILNVTTLAMLRLEQMIDSLSPETRKRYMHHYNFPPYSTGETGFMRGPKRREIGHGALAERALLPVLPPKDEFPYAIRTVSEAISSNGSTSMGSVCASTLSLLAAGVPLKAPVAGIAMGLVYEGGDYGVLTDILGAEDAYGDMDFKVAGTREYVTALQLDTKLEGIPSDVLARALNQARDARLEILDVMNEAIDGPAEMSPFAPRILIEKIPVDKIGEVIGPKGKVINQIQADTGADLTIEDDGTIYIGATDGLKAEAALQAIRQIVSPQMPQVGERFLGTVVKTTAFGAFVSLTPGKDGLIHISKLGKGKRLAKVEDAVNVGDKLQVEILEVDQRGKISLGLVDNAAPSADAPKADAPADADAAATTPAE